MKMVRHLIPASIALILLASQFGLLAGRPPADLGVRDGRLKPPSMTRNSVSSQADLHPDHPQHDYAAIAPFPFRQGDAATSRRALLATLQASPGLRVRIAEAGYIHAEAQTPWLKFVDDVEFWFNPAQGVIEVRSASRLGREDFGVNRERVEAIRQRYLAQP